MLCVRPVEPLQAVNFPHKQQYSYKLSVSEITL